VGFLCRWCSYTGADLADPNRVQYPANLAGIRVMCSGRVDPTFVVKAFADGADGVLGIHKTPIQSADFADNVNREAQEGA